MATQLQLRRGTTTENNNFTGAEAELTYDSTTKGLRIHNGSTKGGYLVDTVVAFQAPTASNNYTWYRKYSSGWVEQGGRWTGSQTCEQGAETGVSVNLPITMRDARYYANASVVNIYLFQMRYQPATKKVIFGFGAYTVARTLTEFVWTVSGMAA